LNNSSQGSQGTSVASVKLMIFGGRGHKTYLGCLDCSPSAYDSIWNNDGPYGSCPLAADTLWCHGLAADFGAPGLSSSYSACSESADDPPVIVDHSGKYYGRYSVGEGAGAHPDSVCMSGGRFAWGRACGAVLRTCRTP
jgi:hypothetical protein